MLAIILKVARSTMILSKSNKIFLRIITKYSYTVDYFKFPLPVWSVLIIFELIKQVRKATH